MNISVPAKSILLIFILSFQYTYSQSSGEKSVISNDEKDYLKKFIYPLQSYEPEVGFKKDSLVFNRFFSTSKIVGLGEASHGSSEIFKIKDKLTRYILQKNNGGVFSIEAAMPESFLINEYIIKENRTGKDYLMNIKSWIYQTDEILRMVEWMKVYNDKNNQKIQFTGFDMMSYTGSVVQLKILMDKYQIPTNNLIGLTQNIYNFSQLKLNQISEKKRIKNEVLVDLNKIKAFSPKISDPEDNLWFLQYVTLLDQYLNKTYSDRNLFMAKNIFWLKNKYPDSTFVLWAHNEHLKKTQDETGRFLKEKFNDEYVACGTFFYEGFHSVFDLDDEKIKPVYLKKNPEKSFEELLNTFDIPIFILDLKTIKKENNKLGKSILNKINYRTIGSAQSKNDFKSGNISEDFDYIIFIKKSTASMVIK